ncbi:DUF421 domain-containing protein [Micromonospora lutea]|uniref:DUF421 domain-containing protein n=1 Tax=Micromonospora lutea TaxID=419825 RepID=A0ABQ4IZ76_9ACTN|nr:YetF domain-containing protein [Micromonospora lutea]GIJ23076.1 DUF421 domain-containing protein [Micromonospora lutea]
MPDWGAMFTPTVPLLEIFIRGTVTFLSVLLLMRLTGQREAGGLGITDVLLVVLVAQAAASGLVGETSSIVDGILLVATIVGWSVALDAASYRWPHLARLIKPHPRILINNGRLNRRLMHREFMTRQEVLSQLRLHGIEELSEVQRAYLEPNGMISVVRRNQDAVDEPVKPPMEP